MTPEEIKKVAEEYLNKAFKGKPVSKSMAGGAIFGFIEFITARFYLVEKGKVEHSRDAIKFFKEVGYQDRLDLRDSLFGPDIRKEVEE